LAYIAFSYKGADTINIISMAMYPVLIFILAGNFRVMLVYCKFDKWQLISYKLLKLFGAIFFLLYGSYETKNKNVSNPDVFLLYIFATFEFYT